MMSANVAIIFFMYPNVVMFFNPFALKALSLEQTWVLAELLQEMRKNFRE